MKGKTACKGCHVPTAKLDQAIMQAVRDKLLTAEHLTAILEVLVDRPAGKDVGVANRRPALDAEFKDSGDKLARLYRAIEEGVVELDAQLKERIAALKSTRDLTGPRLSACPDPGPYCRLLGSGREEDRNRRHPGPEA